MESRASIAAQAAALTRFRGQPTGWKSWAGAAGRFIVAKPLGAAGGFLVLLMVFTAVAAPVISPYGPLEIDPAASIEAPSFAHLMGTDELGRDILSRIIYGSQASLYVGILAITIGSGAGTVLGMVSAYAGGKFDLLVQRVVDSIQAFPFLVLALALVAALGQSINNVVIALSIVLAPGVARVVRGAALSVKQNQYMEAARALGAGHLRIIFAHMLPNVFVSVIVLVSIQLGSVIIVEASLSFLGLGTPPPTPTWGGMLSGTGRQYFEIAPWLAVFPGLAISLAVLGFNLFGDALRDVLDPRMRGT